MNYSEKKNWYPWMDYESCVVTNSDMLLLSGYEWEYV